LASESWASPPLFDHELVARLVELGLVEAEPLASSERIHDYCGGPRCHVLIPRYQGKSAVSSAACVNVATDDDAGNTPRHVVGIF
jgi:hypothetical protein